ncbi:MAG: LuxR C-terminal-related transcriptional regulator, partial [Spirochaetaceae bacterium]|nr:LuxR C-terminal-related transcriptional regulator [Spirochaetaceae bacterium]
MGELSELFFSTTPDKIAEGCAQAGADGDYVCLICGRRAEKGRIYKVGEDFYEARRSIREHIAAEHGSILDFLLGLDKRLTGVTEQQRELIKKFASGESDKQIASALGIAGSTVRNHRFALRERARQAKVFLGIISLMEQAEPAGAELVG